MRAVAFDLGDIPDAAPPVITISIDNSGVTDIDEVVNTEGLQESNTAVDDLVDSSAASADAAITGTASIALSRSESYLVSPRVLNSPTPKRKPAAAASAIAVNSNGPCAVTK